MIKINFQFYYLVVGLFNIVTCKSFSCSCIIEAAQSYIFYTLGRKRTIKETVRKLLTENVQRIF